MCGLLKRGTIQVFSLPTFFHSTVILYAFKLNRLIVFQEELPQEGFVIKVATRLAEILTM